MSISKDSLERIEEHWAVRSIGKEKIRQAYNMAMIRQVNASLGNQINISLSVNDNSLFIEHVAGVYELAALEGIHALLYPATGDMNKALKEQAQTGAYKAYELKCTIDVPNDDKSRIYHVLHIAALAYCGERWTDIRRWLKEHPNAIEIPNVNNVSWENRILYRLFDCWIRLFRKNQMG